MSDDLKFECSFSCIVIGPSDSGNSTFCILFLDNYDLLCTERDFDGGLIWCYRARIAFFSRQLFAEMMRKISFNEGVPAGFENARGRPYLLIPDDLLNNADSQQLL